MNTRDLRAKATQNGDKKISESGKHLLTPMECK